MGGTRDLLVLLLTVTVESGEAEHTISSRDQSGRAQNMQVPVAVEPEDRAVMGLKSGKASWREWDLKWLVGVTFTI